MSTCETDRRHMRRALELATRGQGCVEPNPMVGCVIAFGDAVISEGWHQAYGDPHAEIEALRKATESVAGSTMYVTLEPCCHHGKTPPCVDQILQNGIQRVVIAESDPFPEVGGRGIERLVAAGLKVETGILEIEAGQLNAPYHKLVRLERPWVLAKWAMTLDGQIASHTGSSRWISSESSRAVVHQLRGRVDAVLVGRETVEQDDPLLTARPPGLRVATRIVLDSQASISLDAKLVQTANEVPVLVVVGPQASDNDCQRLTETGCETFRCRGDSWTERLDELLEELGRRRMTNVLAEGGGNVLGTLFDMRAIDEVHVFVATKLIGGVDARRALLGHGIAEMARAQSLESPAIRFCDGDIYVRGFLSC